MAGGRRSDVVDDEVGDDYQLKQSERLAHKEQDLLFWKPATTVAMQIERIEVVRMISSQRARYNAMVATGDARELQIERREKKIN